MAEKWFWRRHIKCRLHESRLPTQLKVIMKKIINVSEREHNVSEQRPIKQKKYIM